MTGQSHDGAIFVLMFTELRIVSHVNLRAEDGATALMMAAQGGRVTCVQLLLDFGADVNIEVRVLLSQKIPIVSCFCRGLSLISQFQADDGTLAAHLACISHSNAASVLELVLASTEVTRLEAACTVRPPEPLSRTIDKKVRSANQRPALQLLTNHR